MQRYIAKLDEKQRQRLGDSAKAGYGPQVKALVGFLYASLNFTVSPGLKKSLNPTTTYKLGFDPKIWSNAKDWNIQ